MLGAASIGDAATIRNFTVVDLDKNLNGKFTVIQALKCYLSGYC